MRLMACIATLLSISTFGSVYLTSSLLADAGVLQSGPSGRGEGFHRESRGESEGGRLGTRIVSTNLAIDEMLLDLLSPAEVFGVSVFGVDPGLSNVRPAASAVPHRFRIGVAGEIEPLIAARPTTVLLSPFSLSRARSLLAQAQIPTIDIPAATSLEGIRENLRLLGRLTGREERARRLIDRFDARIEAIRRRHRAEVGPNGIVGSRSGRRILLYDRGWVAGENTLFDELLGIVDARNAAAELGISGHRYLDEERLIDLDPQALVLSLHNADGRARHLFASDVSARSPRLAHLTASREGRVCSIAPRLLRSTTHYVVGAAEALSACFDRWRW